MKKKIYIRVLAIVLVLSLVGCGSPVENNVQPTTSDSSNITQSESVVNQETEEIPDTTKIIIAQRISSVEDADMIIVLDDGKIDGIGTNDELIKNNTIYRDIVNVQKKGGKLGE